MTDYKNKLQARINNVISTLWENDKKLEFSFEKPNIKEHGDYTANIAMLLAKHLGQAPMTVAEKIVERLGKIEFVEKIEIAKPGFINFYLDNDILVTNTLRAAIEGTLLDPVQQHNKVIVEHTSVNPNKAMHVGHIRNAILGDSIIRLMKRLNYKVEVHNYIDDTGVQVADTVNALLNLDIKQPDNQNFDDFCWDIYSEINREYETNTDLLTKRTEVLHQIEERDNDIAKEAKIIVDKIVDCHLELLADFDIKYDLLVYESDIIDFAFWETAFELLKQSPHFIFETVGENKNCWVLKYENEKFGDKIFVRSNGTKVYTAKDTAYHLWKFGLLSKDFLYKEWSRKFNNHTTWKTDMEGEMRKGFGNANIIVNVIDERQTYPQEMVKHALSSLGYREEAQNYTHVAYGVVSLSKQTAEALGVDVSDGKDVYAMSGRKGIGVKVTDLVKLLENEIEKIQEDPDLDRSISGVAQIRDIAIGAVKHYMLKYNPNSMVTFDYQQALQLVGNTGPYLQYSHARASNILEKAGNYERLFSKGKPLTDSELDLAKQVGRWPEIIEVALDTFNISAIVDYAFELSQTLNTFYEHNNVLKSDQKTKSFRLTLVEAYTNVIKDALNILGIMAPQRM